MHKICSSSCHLLHAMSFDLHSTPPLLFSTLPSSISPALSGSCSTSIQPETCADPRDLGGDGFTESDPRTEKEFAISGKQKGSVREETNAVSGTRVMIVQNRHQKPLRPLSHQHQEEEVHREKGASEAEASLGSPTDRRAKTS